MTKTVLVTKDEDYQCNVPTEWRPVFEAIVRHIAAGDFRIERIDSKISALSVDDVGLIKNNIEDYGACLIDLPPQSWDTSVCQWMLTYWEVCVDLFTKSEGRSDLALMARVYEDREGFSFKVESLHVP